MAIFNIIEELNNEETLSSIDRKSSIEDMIEQLDESNSKVSFPSSLIKNYNKLDLKPNEWAFYCLVETFIADGKEVPYQLEMAEMLNMGQRNITNIISELKNKGYLELNKTGDRTVYDFSKLILAAERLS